MTNLAEKNCVPCRGGVPGLTESEIRSLITQVEGWEVLSAATPTHKLQRSFKFPDFVTALKFVNTIGEIAEKEAHHPDIHLSWGKVVVEIWTHKIAGLTESDFILAAKIDAASR